MDSLGCMVTSWPIVKHLVFTKDNEQAKSCFSSGAKTTQWKKKYSFQLMMLEQMDSHMKNNEIGPLPPTIYKN